MSYAQLAHDSRNKAVADMRSILDRAAEESRDLTPEEVEMVERAEADAVKYGKESERALRADELAKEAAEFRGLPDPVKTAIEPAKEDEGTAFTRMWKQAVSGGVASYEADLDTQMRAMVIADGHVPTTFSQQVVVYERDYTPMLNPEIVTIMPTNDGNPISIPRLTADVAHGGTITAEAGGIQEVDPTMGTATLNAYKFAVTTLWSAEVDTDNNIGLQNLIARTNARELAHDINAAMSTGNGSTFPNGIVTAAGNGGTANGTAAGSSFDTFFAPADLIDLEFSLAQPYRRNGSYMGSTTAIAKMRKARDSNGAFLWDMSLVAGQPDRFNGKRVIENADMAAVASATKSVIFGDLSAYIVRRLPLRVDASIHYKFSTDQIALRTIERMDGDLIDTAAVNYLVSANT